MTGGGHLLGLPFGWGAIFSLIGALISGGTLGAWIKSRADERVKLAEIRVTADKAESDSETQLRQEMWKDIEALKLSKEDQSRRLTLAETRLIEQSVELGQHRFLLKLVTDELDRVSPGNPVAKQAREMLRDMQRSALPAAEEIGPMAEIVAKLCREGPPEEQVK